MRNKVGFARRIAIKSPFCDGRVTLLARPTFLYINTEERPPASQLGQGERPPEHVRAHDKSSTVDKDWTQKDW